MPSEIFFANGRSMSVKAYRVDGDAITVAPAAAAAKPASMRRSSSRIAPDEMPEVRMPAVIAAAASGRTRRHRLIDARPFAALIETVALKHGVDPDLVHAVVQAESNYQPQRPLARWARAG